MTKRCVKCWLICNRARAKSGQQVSASLPRERINTIAGRLVGLHVGTLGKIRKDVPPEGAWEVLP